MIASPSPPAVRWRKSTQAEDGRPPLIVMLHGRGADEHDLFELAPAFDPEYAIASVRAPIALPEGGYTWSESRAVGRAVAESLRASLGWLQRWLDSLSAGRAEPQRVYLMGFSAGMMMASALLFDQPVRYSGAILLSGVLPFDTDLSITKGRLTDVDVFYGHGSFDTVIPGDLVDRTATYLTDRSGARLEAHTYPIGHEISAPEVADITRWLARH